jgi:hypothetical protein
VGTRRPEPQAKHLEPNPGKQAALKEIRRRGTREVGRRFFEDSIFSPPLLPRILTKPRTVCPCQPVVAMISASAAPLTRFSSALTWAFLFARSALDLPPAFFALCVD